MGSVTFDQLARKFERLPEQAKKETYDFIEFLIQKKKSRKKKVDKKKILLGMSCWSDEDIKAIDEARGIAHQSGTKSPLVLDENTKK